MPYYVITGVRSGQVRYGPGAVLPEGVGDEPMVEAGAVEWHESDEIPWPPPESAELVLPAETSDLDAMNMKALRKAAKAAGVNSFGKSADALRDELKAVT